MHYGKEVKLQALQLSDEIGVKAATEQPGIKHCTLTDWRSIRKARGTQAFVGSGHNVPLMERIVRFQNRKLNFAKVDVRMKCSKRHQFFASGRKK